MAWTLGFLLTVLLCAGSSAQLFHPVPNLPSYSTVSIRPSDPWEIEPHGSVTEGTYRAQRTTVRELIAYAFGLGFEQELVNAPAWVLNDRFDLQAKLVEDQLKAFQKLGRNEREEQMRLMMQSTLAERFQLAYYFGSRTLSVFELQIAKGGSKCPLDTTSPPAIADPTRPHFRWYNAPAPTPPTRDSPAPSLPALKLRTRGWPFWLLVSWVGHQPELDGGPVVDKTGLDSSYDCQMTWAHGQSEEAVESFFPALQNQLGLKLQPAKDPVEVLVVDSIRKPSDN
jgi:bla regulator protein BlaR1